MTGASSGIGLAIAKLLLEANATVSSLGRRQPLIDSNRLLHTPCDLSNLKSLPEVLKQVKAKSSPTDILLIAGYGDFGSLEEFSNSRIQKLINTNLTSAIMILREFIPVLKKQNRGDIIFMGSEAALQGGKKGAVYCATKFALRGLAQSLREECSTSGVRVSIVNSGMVDTPFFSDLNFQPGESKDNSISAEEVARGFVHILNAPLNTVIDEINLSPMKTVIRNKNN